MIEPRTGAPGDEAAAAPAVDGRRRKAGRPRPQDLAGLRVLVEGRGGLGTLNRGLEATRDLAEHGAEVVLVDHGLEPALLKEVQRRAPHVATLPSAAKRRLLTPSGDAPPPRFVLVLSPAVAVGHDDARQLMAVLGRSAPGAGLAPALWTPGGVAFGPEVLRRRPLAWMVRPADLLSGVSLRVREHRGCRALVQRPDEIPCGA